MGQLYSDLGKEVPADTQGPLIPPLCIHIRGGLGFPTEPTHGDAWRLETPLQPSQTQPVGCWIGTPEAREGVCIQWPAWPQNHGHNSSIMTSQNISKGNQQKCPSHAYHLLLIVIIANIF